MGFRLARIKAAFDERKAERNQRMHVKQPKKGMDATVTLVSIATHQYQAKVGKPIAAHEFCN